MVRDVIAILICPICSSKLVEKQDHLECSQCGARYSVVDGRIIDFVGKDQGWVGVFEKLPGLYDPWSRIGWRLGGRGSLNDFYEELAGDLSEGVLVDAGCGTGTLLHMLERKRYRGALIGIDISMPMLKRASHKTERAVFLRASMDKIPIADRAIDHYVSSLAIHMLMDKAKAISELSRILKKGGNVRVAVATTDSIRGKIFNLLLRAHSINASDYITLFETNNIEIMRTIDLGIFKAFYGVKRI